MKIDRLISIIMLLLEKQRIAAQELAAMFEVSPRTIYRDIDAINLAGIPVFATPGVGGGFEILPQYKIDKKVFSTTELSTILMGLSNLSSVVRGAEIVNALVKVKSFIPAEKAKDIAIKSSQVLIDLRSWLGNRNIPAYLETIKAAIQDNKLLAFEYTDRYGNKSERKAEPYQLVLKGSHWYWQGYCLLRNDFRLFKISRTANLQEQEISFIPKDYPKPQLDVTDLLATIQIRIKLRVHQSIMDDVLDYCAFENFSLEDSEYYIVNFPFVENDYYYNILFSFGNKCECLQPKHVRQEIKRRLQELSAIYAD